MADPLCADCGHPHAHWLTCYSAMKRRCWFRDTIMTPTLDECANCNVFSVARVRRVDGRIQYRFENRWIADDPFWLTEDQYRRLIAELQALMVTDPEDEDDPCHTT